MSTDTEPSSTEALTTDDTDSPAAPARSIAQRLGRPALALGSGLLTALALPPWGFWPLAIIGIMLFEVSLGEFPSRRERALRGFLFGAGWMFLGMAWMVQLTAPGYVVACLIFAALHGVAAAVAPTGSWRVIGRPAAHALVEALRLSFPFGGIPLATLGISQVAGPLGGIARVGGVILLTWVVFQLGFALAGPAPGVPAFARRMRPGAGGQPHGTLAFLAIIVVIVISVVAPTGSPTGQTLSVAAVQGGGEQGTSALEVPSSLVTERHLEATRSIDADASLDFVLWPENTIDVNNVRSTEVFEDFSNSAIRDQIEAETQRLGVPIAVGITEDANTGLPDERRYTNAQVVVTASGEIVDRYDKVRRVPFGEYVPFRGALENITSAVDQVGEAMAGTERAYLDVPLADGEDPVRLATVISWEVFFGGRVREGVKDGAVAILNPTNGASYTGTIVQTQQVASSRLRAIETGRWVVQAAPTGFTAIINSEGDVLQRTSVSEQRVLYADIELRTGRTWYVSLGDGPFIWLLLAVFATSLWMSRRTTRARFVSAQT